MSSEPPVPHVQNPIRGSTIDTSPHSLGLEESGETAPANQSRNRTSSTSLSRSVIKRVEQTAAKLGNTVLGSSTPGIRRDSASTQPAAKQQQPQGESSKGGLSMSLSSASPRRFLSLSRKGKEREQGAYPSGTHIIILFSPSPLASLLVPSVSLNR